MKTQSNTLLFRAHIVSFLTLMAVSAFLAFGLTGCKEDPTPEERAQTAPPPVQEVVRLTPAQWISQASQALMKEADEACSRLAFFERDDCYGQFYNGWASSQQKQDSQIVYMQPKLPKDWYKQYDMLFTRSQSCPRRSQEPGSARVRAECLSEIAVEKELLIARLDGKEDELLVQHLTYDEGDVEEEPVEPPSHKVRR